MFTTILGMLGTLVSFIGINGIVGFILGLLAAEKFGLTWVASVMSTIWGWLGNLFNQTPPAAPPPPAPAS